MKKMTIATRGSKLALWQAKHIAACIFSEHGIESELLVLKTKGDIILDVPLAKVGGKGLFVKEIEEALLDGRADIAVHSMKDVPMVLPEGLCLGAIPKREVAHDVLLSVKYADLKSLPSNAIVGTSSLRRQAQLLQLRPDLQITMLRGNIDTRLKKLEQGDYDAIVMAAAGLNRLGLTVKYAFPLTAPDFLPAAGQGALGIEYKKERKDLDSLLHFLRDDETSHCVIAERAFLAELEGSCQVPIAAFAQYSKKDKSISLTGFVAEPDGSHCISEKIAGLAKDASNLGVQLAKTIKNKGAQDILQRLYSEESHEKI